MFWWGVVGGGGGEGRLSGVRSEEAAMPSRARGWAESREGMSLLMVALAFLARTSLRVAAGARPREGLVRPMVGVELVSWGCWGCLGRGVFLSDGDVMVLFETTVEKKMRVPCRVMQRCGEAGEVHE